MKDQYACDISDYFKYAYLRRLQRSGAALVIVWMLTEPDSGPDGRKLDYLRQPDRYRSVDPELFDALAEVQKSGWQSLVAVEASGVLGDAYCYGRPVPDQPEARADWLWKLEPAIFRGDRPVVFFDPDNGLEIESKKLGHKNSSKFLFLNEFAATARGGRSVIVYQHLGQRQMPRDEFVAAQLERLAEAWPGYEYFALEGPHAALLCAALPDGPDLVSPARDLAEAWPGDSARITSA